MTDKPVGEGRTTTIKPKKTRSKPGFKRVFVDLTDAQYGVIEKLAVDDYRIPQEMLSVLVKRNFSKLVGEDN